MVASTRAVSDDEERKLIGSDGVDTLPPLWRVATYDEVEVVPVASSCCIEEAEEEEEDDAVDGNSEMDLIVTLKV
jgi:hypothetical protein